MELSRHLAEESFHDVSKLGGNIWRVFSQTKPDPKASSARARLSGMRKVATCES
jgi:hypothetical protein